jgi:hypothetical protein
MWRVIWTPIDGTWPDYADWDTAIQAMNCAARLRTQGITDATIHNLKGNA